jgi:Mg-chelatase subunit ChlD
MPKIPLLFSKLEIEIHESLCQEIYPVSVKLDGHPLTGLEESNFNVSVDGKQVQFKLVRDLTVNTMVLLDTSGSMAAPWKIEAGKNMTRFIVNMAIKSGGKAALITFNDDIKLVCSWTNNLNTIDQELNKLQGSGSTRLWDAAKEATQYIQTTNSMRTCELTLLIIISDFGDTGSSATREDVLKNLRGTSVFGIAIVYGTFFDVDISTAKEIAEATHGEYVRASEAKEVISQLQKLLDSLYYLQIIEKGHIKITASYMQRTGSDEIDS